MEELEREVAVSPPGTAPGAASDAGIERKQECISVVARVRPSDDPSSNLVLRQQSIEIALARAGGDVTNPRLDEYRYHFSQVFGPDSTQSDVFNSTARDMVLGALDGVNCTIFAYGQTGSGKTFTICGGKGSYNDRGVIPRALGCLFDAIGSRQDGVTYTIKVSFIEVYKEVGYNLLGKDFGKSSNWPVVSVSIIDDQPILNNATPVTIASEDEGLHQYFIGDTHRTVAETPHNLNSSRSHCLFTIFVEASDATAQTVRTSKVQIVDLAGSERLKPYEVGSQNDKVLMGQAVSINLSLHWLESVINALNSKSRGSIPYRNSFLTKCLKDALGGNARAVMFATVNPSDMALPETLSTCRFAQRVANVQTNARVNEELDPKLLIAALKQEKAELRAALVAAEGGEDVEEVSPDEMKRRVRAYLEGESGGSEGGATLSVGCLRDAFTAFRIFRDLFWESLRTRPAAAPPAALQSAPLRGAAASDDSAKTACAQQTAAGGSVASSEDNGTDQKQPEAHRRTGGSGDSSGGVDPQLLASLQQELKDRDGELKMLRAALAAQPERPAARASRPAPPLRCTRIAVGTQTEAVRTPKKPKPKRPSSADARPNRPAAAFSMDDVVERSFARDGSSSFLPRISDGRVPDFRRRSESADARPDFSQTDIARSQSGIDSLRAGQATQAPRSKISWDMPASSPSQPTASALAVDSPAASSARPTPAPSPAAAAAEAPVPPAKSTGFAGASAAWLSATTALTQAELALVGDAAKAREVFLQHDPRAGDIWPNDMKALRSERVERMEEARKLGEDIERIKEAKVKVQAALEALKVKLREAESQAAIDPGGPAQNTVATLRVLLTTEEPKLVQLLNEKQQQYELDYNRLAELKRELAHLKHGEDKLSAAIQAEFGHWRQAVEERYPGSTKPAQTNATAASSSTPLSASSRLSPSGSPPPLPRTADTAGEPSSSSSLRTSALSSDNASGTVRAPGARAELPAFARIQAGVPAEESEPARAQAAPVQAQASEPSSALAKAEAALRSLRDRLEDARQSGDTHRQQMLEQLLSVEEPRIARLRADGKM